MVKGINRQVLELNDTGSRYFEKAFFFVKPEYSRESESVLRQSALRAVNEGLSVPKSRRQKVKSKIALFAELLVSAGAGAIITAVIIK
ncbi:MAG: hypothetical protein K2G60_06585 [Oscillospiraceae bacterium]|nr:hypothetical protein [Oscillospiraceae bacterium]